MHSLPELWFQVTYLGYHSAVCQDAFHCFSCISTDDASFAPSFLLQSLAWGQLQTLSKFHHGITSPLLSPGQNPFCQLPGRAGHSSCLPPGPCSSRHSQQPQFDTLVFLPSAVFFIVTGPQVHKSSFCFSTSGSYLNLCFCSWPASSLSSPLTSVSVNMNTKLLGLLFRSHHQSSQTLCFLQSRPSRLLAFLTSPFFWIRGKSSPVHLQNPWSYSLPHLIHPQSQLPQPTSKIQPVP